MRSGGTAATIDAMSPDLAVQMRGATTGDEAFIVEMARYACIIEDWPLPDPDDEEVLSMLPPPGVVPIIAQDPTGVPAGRGRVDVAQRSTAAGRCCWLVGA